MDYFTDADKCVLLAGIVGAMVGSAISLQEAGLDKWLRQIWLGWDRLLSRTIVSSIVWTILLSAFTFIHILYDAGKPLSAISTETTRLGIFMCFFWPIATQGVNWLEHKVDNRSK
ncbi:MAG: hypothetical protein AAFY72_14195 [Cyanobacteria bacterium J06649_4]